MDEADGGYPRMGRKVRQNESKRGMRDHAVFCKNCPVVRFAASEPAGLRVLNLSVAVALFRNWPLASNCAERFPGENPNGFT